MMCARFCIPAPRLSSWARDAESAWPRHPQPVPGSDRNGPALSFPRHRVRGPLAGDEVWWELIGPDDVCEHVDRNWS